MRPTLSNTQSLVAAVALSLVALSGTATAAEEASTALSTQTLAGLSMRSIGPALMGGRIADLTVDPRDARTWYLAVGSGGLWKTVNAGVTWTPIFDDEGSYSIGSVALDPSSPDTVWVGTGENVSGRHVGWGDGVYKSLDGGKSWRNVGLARSEHIGKIIVDPRDGNVVYVAAEGPLWAAGGDRGVFKTTDGGATWRLVLTLDEHTGATDLEIDPRDPDVLYAAAYQRRRHVWSLLAGGPGSGIHKSTDGGETWRRIERGLPEGDMGKIGLAVSPANPDIVYATIEADEKERGFYRSLDRGESWEKRNGYLSDGTGPHYYQEIEASPHDVDTVYQVDVFLHVTHDGGKTFDYLGDGHQKHSDNHALWIDPNDPEHLLAGTDASLYESFDDGATWRQFPNLPISQFYKLCLDSAEPFYNILGGAQDLGTLLGPSRTTNTEGVRNRDWFVPLGADGYSCAFDPEEPDIAYMELQGGSLHRYDRASHELLDIRPVPAPGEPPERFNWDAPILVSPHASERLYFGSQRLWRSDDRGNSWRAVSGDLTRGANRYELEIAGRVWSVDALYDNGAMSVYATLTSLAESPLVEGLLYAGSDDGLIQVSEDGGGSWRRAGLPPISDTLFVNALQASAHDPDTVFAALDNHKLGDFRPHLLESRDRGRSWRSVAGDLPTTGVVWSIAQDAVEPDLLFAGAEYGVYFTTDRGRHWTRLPGPPTIPFRDLAIQSRDGDLVGATFGRGFYVLDDYAPLRDIAGGALERDALFPVRDAWLYVPSVPGQAEGQPSMGSDAYSGANPPFGALLTYHLKDDRETSRTARREREGALRERGEDVPFPGWETLREEPLESEPRVILTVRDPSGAAVRRIFGPAKAGIHRLSWDLRLPPPDPVDLETPGFRPPWAGDSIGPLAAPGTYSVEMAISTRDGLETIGEARTFEVRPVPSFTLEAPDFAEVARFQRRTAELLRRARGAADEIGEGRDRLEHLRAALDAAPGADPALYQRLDELGAALARLEIRLRRDPARARLNEPAVPSVLDRLGRVAGSHWSTRQTPTATMRASVEVAERELAEIVPALARVIERELPELEARLEAAGAPWTPGRELLPPEDDG